MTYEPECEECGVKTAKLTKTKDGKLALCEACKPIKMWLPFVEALYMYNTFGVVSYTRDLGTCNDNIQGIFPPVIDMDFGEILEEFKDIKFYIKDEWLPFFEPKHGDKDDNGFEYLKFGGCLQWVKKGKKGFLLQDKKTPIFIRDKRHFFMPTTEV